ncbi:TonB-dependent receptor [Terriglobus saanensis]|uniref:Cna B domain-containing protein n=1 Tax=Terriglobus saanensis (strain ATCC BAA-1853 / DSM 23119 / SP1PR4) TaxID=401053 RepID=E8V127_TERSS|nr:carboxypeptidase regulatory-like domain-containing protein [Terriglobus saanensis]ADV83375.1 Cna B domain-containing protein [Terriglobus saanensis SP1PR4]
MRVLRPFHLVFLVMVGALVPWVALAQSTATLSGTITDPLGAVVAGASIVVHNLATGADRTITSDNAGSYVVPSLAPSDYSVRVTAPGFGTYTLQKLTLLVDAKTGLDVAMKLESAGETVLVESATPIIDSESITVGQVIDRQTVQEIPLNGRHFLDLTVLTPGGVTAPAAGSLTAPSRGLGANSFVTAGNREDSVNFQINGVNLNDLTQNQITFQPSINTTSEFKINNQTFSAEYGRSSGSVVNVSTRSGTNTFHGEAFEYLRNEALDARNYFNPKGTRIAPLKRHNFGGAFGGPIWKDHTFFFASYEGLRQSQGLTINSGVLTAAQRAGVTDPVARNLLALIPVANDSTGSRFVGIAGGPVQTDQGTIDVSQTFHSNDTVHGFYALQKDVRTEPTLQGNTVSGFGDHRAATRQVLTVNETHVFTPRLVNEARLGFNRISISFNPNVTTDPTTLGIDTGTTGPNGIPQITITGPNLNFGGPSGFPQGRFDTLGIFSDTATYTVGKHSIKFGGEFRRFLNVNFSQDTGTIGFNTIANFQAGGANSFTITPTRTSNRLYVNALGAFVQDAWKPLPQLTLELGLRYEWNGSPMDGANRLVVFDLPTASLFRVGTNGYGNSPYQQNYNYEPRLGFAYDVFGSGKTVLRGAYGYMADQPESNVIGNLNSNPPFANRVNYSNSAVTIPLNNLYNSAGLAGIGISGVQRNMRNAYTETFNVNVQHELPFGVVTSVGYYGSVGKHLRTPLNVNQPNAAGVRPFQSIAASSPISAGANISNVNITQVSSIGMSNYNAMWLTARKAFRNGLNFNFNYNYSKSMDTGSLSGTVLQDATRPYLNYGPSDFDTRHRISLNAIYTLPFRGNRLVEGWQLSGITQWQTGNPLNITTTSTFTGTANVLHPNLLRPVQYGLTRPSNVTVQWFNPSTCTTPAATCTFQLPSTGFGNMSRNSLVGPGFADTDFSIEKNTKITESVQFQLRADAFDILNHASFGNPTTSANSTTFGIISSTRFPVGDLGSSRQLQIIGKIIF